jgi:hypothetical protein
MNEAVYTRLREFIDTLPGGYPATPSGVCSRARQASGELNRPGIAGISIPREAGVMAGRGRHS